MNENSGQKWFNSPMRFHEGDLQSIREHIPDFEQRDFVQAKSEEGNETEVNPTLNTVVRKPFGEDGKSIPIGVVSKNYALVLHTAVLDAAKKAFEAAKIKLDEVKVKLKITEYGERMHLSLFLPGRYSFDPGDGNSLALRLECFNSVDGSTRFRAHMGWYRWVCSNGLMAGVTQFDFRRRHLGEIDLRDIETILVHGIKNSEKEKRNFEKWRDTRITTDNLIPWFTNGLKKRWGFKATARAYHISREGYDVEVLRPYKGNTPLTIPVRKTRSVPGAPKKTENLYDVSQILSWLAKERRDIQEQLEWMEQIPELLKPLMN